MSLRLPRRSARPLFWLAVSFFVACSGGGGCGACACMQKIPGGYQGRKLDNAMAARFTNDGFTFLSQNFSLLLTQAGVTNPMTLPVACSPQSGGNFCDQNRNGQCDTGEQCSATVNIQSFSLAPGTSPAADTGVINGTMQLQIATGDMWYMKPNAACLPWPFQNTCCDLVCSANFLSTRSGAQQETFTATVNFTIDATWGRILAFNVGVGGINNLESNDLNVGASGVCGTLTCGLLDIGFIKNIVVDQFLKPQIQAQVQKAIDQARCRACAVAADCPAGSTCTSGVCQAAGGCVPTLMGTEGRADLAQAGAGGMAMSGKVDLYAVAGGTVSSQAASHFTAGVLGGAEPYTGSGDGGVALRGPAPCVPFVPAPGGTIATPDWAAADGGYHFGMAIADRWLDQVMWATHQAGGMCLDLGTAQVGMISTGLFKTFLPSLGLVAPDDAPMIMAIRPKLPPTVTLGKGTFDGGTGRPIDPLINLKWVDLDIDVYALVDDRYVRLFRLVADMNLPLSLVFQGCDQVTPVLGDIKQLLTNVRAMQSEILAEDPQVLADLIPTFLSLAESSLAGGLGPQTLPAIGSFRLKVTELKGITPVTGSPAFQHIGLFAQMLPPGAACAVAAPRVTASLERTLVPPAEALRATGRGLPWPSAVLRVASDGYAAVEYATRVDHGLWSTFAPAPEGTVSVTSPGFLLQGRHVVEVRARRADEPHGVSTPVPVDVVVDFEAPSVALAVDRAADRLVVRARDLVTPEASLRFAYQVGAGTPSAFGPARAISLSAVEAQGGVTVLVQDEAGLVGQAVWKAPVLGPVPNAEALAPQSSGCTSAPGASLLLAALALAWRRRSASAAGRLRT